MLFNRKELEEQKNDLITRAEQSVNKAKEEKRELTDDEMAELAEIRDNVRKIVEKLKLDDDFNGMEDKKPKPEPKPAANGGNDQNAQNATDEDKQKQQEQNETRAFENYIRGKLVHERAGELTKSDNGAVIPTTIAQKIIKHVYDVSPVLDKSTKYNVKGNLQIPYYDDQTSTLKVAYQDEFKPLTSSNGTFKSITLTGFLAGALSKVSNSLINNSQFDIVNFVVTEMGDSIARFIEHELLQGTSGKVTGLSTVKNVTTTASATAITGDEVIKLKDSVKDAFQNNAIFIMSNSTRTALRTLKDSTGRYLLNDDVTSPFGTTLLGKPVFVSDNMDDIADGKTVIYYGDMSCLATKFNEEVNVQVLREKYADEHATGVVGWFEFDSKVENEQGLAKMVMHTAG